MTKTDLEIEIAVKDDSQKTQLTLFFYRKDVQGDIAKLREKWAKRGRKDVLEDFLELHKDLDFIKKKYKLSIVFNDVLRQAIFDGKITRFNRIIQIPIQRKLLDDLEEISDNALWEGDYEVAFIALPEAKLEEIQDSIALLRRKVKKLASKPGTHPYKLRKATWDTKSNLDRDLKWFLLHRQGMSYTQIYNLEKGDAGTITRDGIIKAIRSIEKKLAVEI